MMLRQRVCDLMVRVHRIAPELAAYHVREMTPSEVKQRFLMYARARCDAGMELSVAGPTIKAVNVLPSRFATPATTHAGLRHSTLFPPNEQTEEGEV